jgi:AraC-like DNA-binding protein
MVISFTHCHHDQAKEFVKAFWQTAGMPTYQSETILPKGVVELIFSFGDNVPFYRSNKDEVVCTPRCFVNGINVLPIQVTTPQNQIFFGIELHPAAVKKLLKTPCGEFLNSITDLELINKEFISLWQQLAETDSFEERVNMVQRWIIRKVCPVREQEKAISGFLTETQEPMNVSQLAANFCYSSRQLHRKAQELFGMSTETLIRYKRYVHALKLMHYTDDSLTRIGYHCHYYDQAHFIREFKEYTGLTPGDYRRQKGILAGHLFQ